MIVVSTVFMRAAQVGVAATIAHFITAEIVYPASLVTVVPMFASTGVIAAVSVVAIVAVVDVSPEAPSVAMKPGTCPDKEAAREPLGPVIAIGSAVIGRVVEVAIRAFGGRPNLYSDLRASSLGRSRKKKSGKRDQ
jgi:hypothetical protein